ncbi:hypothetical protein K505DRAFT_337707 [Melanomma pulvis-pyrius CBS 109.77]|uniref:Uncharacterized protein n=1 Tax=Melanomma pulvis-pyrius CBS 109.77 TaxID=1314802 RepID=A0A6A6XBB6_9PLEO|nr:hypothetical protein K505DRAFT_337707 [Melanomma pulvis-pyrius CBS 109.77]
MSSPDLNTLPPAFLAYYLSLLGQPMMVHISVHDCSIVTASLLSSMRGKRISLVFHYAAVFGRGIYVIKQSSLLLYQAGRCSMHELCTAVRQHTTTSHQPFSNRYLLKSQEAKAIGNPNATDPSILAIILQLPTVTQHTRTHRTLRSRWKCNGLTGIWQSPYACHRLSPFPADKGLFRWLGRGLQEQFGDIGDGKEKGMNRASYMQKSGHTVSFTRSAIKLHKAALFVHEARNMGALVDEVVDCTRWGLCRTNTQIRCSKIANSRRGAVAHEFD